MGQRALDKLSHLVHFAMRSVGAQKMAMPFLTPAALWQKTGEKVLDQDGCLCVVACSDGTHNLLLAAASILCDVR